MSVEEVVEFGDEWKILEQGITDVMDILEGNPPSKNAIHPIDGYAAVYKMCTGDYRMRDQCFKRGQKLHDRYIQVLEDYLKSKVVPALKEKHGKALLMELVKRWSDHKFMVTRIRILFCFLDNYVCVKMESPPLKQTGINCFLHMIYKDLNAEVRDAITSNTRLRNAITWELDENVKEEIDVELMKSVVSIFEEIEAPVDSRRRR